MNHNYRVCKLLTSDKKTNSMKISRRQLQQFGLVAATVLLFSSCNRGYGCPMSDFSLAESLVETVVQTLAYLF
jgi:hypothetical protein